MMKGPLLIAAALVVLRVVTERAGAPDSINNLISVAVFYVLIAPIYFALRIARSGDAHPYKTQIMNTAVFAMLARLMVVPTYVLAYRYQWQQVRFTGPGGVVGRTPMEACLTVAGAYVLWILMSIVVGGGIGSLIIRLKRPTYAI